MAMRHAMGAIVVACLFGTVASTASAQTITGETSITAGVSTDQVTAAATQSRVFGETKGLRFFAEGSWTKLTEGDEGRESEAFSSAYPYEGPPRVMEAYAERFARGRRFFGGIRGGRFRTPFGIYNASDHAYSGFLRAPLIRYEGYWGLANTFFEHGVDIVGGTASVQGEITLGRPGDASEDSKRRPGADVIARVQAYRGSLVVGASHVRSETYGPQPWANGSMAFTGLDVRWMSNGVQLRGEFINGQPWDGTRTWGGYVDAFVHVPAMGPVTAVARLEALDYKTARAEFNSAPTGAAAGARIKVSDGLYAQVNVTHRPDEPYGPAVTATDMALTYTVRYPK